MAKIPEPQHLCFRSRSAARVKRHSVKTDMTPMVDLGFLLIAFFVMTTEMSRPYVAKLNMPKEGGTPPTLGESSAVTLLIGSDHLYYYLGDWEKAKAAGQIRETSFSVKNGIGNIIRERQTWLVQAKISEEGKNGLMFIIKPGENARYGQLIDAMDEVQINGVKKYIILKPDEGEVAFLVARSNF
ncbi:MAG TPA: biopolymer transporter ExbD [Chitinophagaceae bacterium]|nr:biopolymer transporter ExbD [Chitinophagaceae bacterium]